MAKLMFQFRSKGRCPTLDEFCKMFDLRPEEVDPEFGIVQTDSVEGLCTALVDESAQIRVKAKLKLMGADTDLAVGFFANPPIEPFGPPEK